MIHSNASSQSSKVRTIGVIMDDIAHIQFGHDTTLALLQACQQRGWRVYYMQQQDLFWQQDGAYATGRFLKVHDHPENWYQLLDSQTIKLGAMDAILMRKDPPFDMAYIFSTYFLDDAVAKGCLVVNHPQALRNANEKFFATHFAHCMPPTVISSRLDILQHFHQQHGKVIFKPLDSMGGEGIFLAQVDEDVDAKINALSQAGSIPIVAQQYLPQIAQGDKRILLVDGEPIPYALARFAKEGSILANLAAGGHGKGIPLGERDYWICQQIGPSLKKMGLLFVGLDVIGDYLTEINVTSPTGLVELEQYFRPNIAGKILDAIECHLKTR